VADCGIVDFNCKLKEFAASTIGDAITKMADAVLEAVGKVVASLGTMWVNIGTPKLTGGGGSSGVNPGDHAANTEGINTVLAYATWVAFGICVLALIVTGARMGLGQRNDGHRHVDRLGVVLVAAIIISAAVGLVTAIAPAVRSNGSPAVAFIQDSLWWYMIAVATIGVIFGAGRMAWEQRAEPGKELVKALMTLVVVSGVGLTAVSLLTVAGDSFSVWLLNGSLGCSIEDSNGTCFGGNMATLLALTSNPAASPTGGLGAILIIVLGLLAIFGSIVQILLMIVRAGMLVVLAGVLPLAAAATNTETGRNMFRKSAGWMLAFILYKPAAAIVYATAFKLAGTNIFKDDGSGLISVITGLTLLTVALIALPALMSLIVPAVSSIASGSGMATAAVAGAAAALPSGAVAAGKLLGGRGGGADTGGASTGPSAPPTGSTSGGGKSAPSSPSGSSGGTGTSGPVGATGAATSGAGGATGAAGAGAGAGAGAAGGGAAAAGAAAGPVGAAVGAAAQAVSGTVKAATGAVQEAAESSSGGPDGSSR
jgi:hypothetical protein